MNILFIHPNQPAQFEFAAVELAKNPANNVVMLSRTNLNVRLPGVRLIGFNDGPQGQAGSNPILKSFSFGSIRAIEVASLCLKLKQEGFSPHAVVAHPGWGDAMFIKTVFPETPLISYMEFYNQRVGADLDFFPKTGQEPNALAKATATNAIHALNFFNADVCLTPTYWQRSVHPPEMHQKIQVLHEGVDTDKCRPDESAALKLPDGRILNRAEHEVVTHVERLFDRYRGFPTFIRAAEILQQKRPDVHIVIVGKDGKGYSPGNFKNFLSEAKLDPERTHFLGHLPYKEYLKVLQVSSAHVYLTAPFVLSWSFMEAMSVGSPIACSATPPVAEVADDKENCLLFDFFQPKQLVEVLDELLDNKEYARELGVAARQKMCEQYDRSKLLPMFVKLITAVASKDGVSGALEEIQSWNVRWGREERLWQENASLYKHTCLG